MYIYFQYLSFGFKLHVDYIILLLILSTHTSYNHRTFWVLNVQLCNFRGIIIRYNKIINVSLIGEILHKYFCWNCLLFWIPIERLGPLTSVTVKNAWYRWKFVDVDNLRFLYWNWYFYNNEKMYIQEVLFCQMLLSHLFIHLKKLCDGTRYVFLIQHQL